MQIPPGVKIFLEGVLREADMNSCDKAIYDAMLRDLDGSLEVVMCFDACTLDVAVIGDEQAATVFVGTPYPIAVGRITNALTIKSKASSSFCMGVKHEVSEGANVQLFNCSESDVHKDWNIITSEGSICQMGDDGAYIV